MKIKLLVLSFAILSGFGSVNAQEENRHEIRLSVSDGITRSIGSVFTVGLVDALTGTKREDAKSAGVYSIGYRYSINRFRIGSDVSFASGSSKLFLLKEKTPSYKESNLALMVLPTVEYQYYKRGAVELYGSAAAGVDITRTSYQKIDQKKDTKPKETASRSAAFAWQANPIAIRIGSNTVGGFLEAGLGSKGFLTAGLNVRF